MQHVFEDFLQGLAHAVDESDLRQTLASAAAAFDLQRFAYFSLPKFSSGKANLVSNYPGEWTDHYLDNRYETVDPVIAHVHMGHYPFHWGVNIGSIEARGRQQQLFDEAASFGIRCGFTVPLKDRCGRVAALTFAADEPNPPFLRVTERHKQAFQLLATCFHIHARRTLSADRTVNGIALTPREYECLQWASRGKSASEIGDILGIKRRTAAFHLDNVRHKLGVRTIVQAVACLASSRPNLH